MAAPTIPAAHSKEARRLKLRTSCLIFSCFRPPDAVLDSAAAEAEKAADSTSPGERRRQERLPQGSWWSRFRAKKTVPVDVAAISHARPARSEAAMALADGAGHAREEEEESTWSSLFRRFIKKRRQEKNHNIRPNHHQHLQQPKSPIRPKGGDGLHHFTSKCRTQVEPAPLYRMHDQIRTGTRTSHPGSPVARALPRLSLSQRRLRSNSGLIVLTVALAMLLLGGLISATACMCVWFYLVPQIRQPSVTDASNRDEDDGRGEDDVNSEERKKMVVLQGLLRRDGRRQSRINNFSSTT